MMMIRGQKTSNNRCALSKKCYAIYLSTWLGVGVVVVVAI